MWGAQKSFGIPYPPNGWKYPVQQMQPSFYCPYSQEGCGRVALTSVGQLTSHVASCPYRPLECRFYYNSDVGQICGHISKFKAAQLSFGGYRSHLVNHHQFRQMNYDNGWHIKEYCIEENIKDEAPDPSWEPVTFDYDGMTFLLVQSLWDDKLYWRVFVVGTEDDALKYKACIDVCSSQHVATRETVNLGKLEVLPIRMYSTDLIGLGSRGNIFKGSYLSLMLDKVEEKFQVEEGVLVDDPSFLWKVFLYVENKPVY